MKWADIPLAAKMAVTSVAVIVGIMGYLTTYQTDAEAQQYQKQHGEQLSLSRVQQLEVIIEQYRYQLLSADLSAAQREWIVDEINRLNKQIACIRAGTC